MNRYDRYEIREYKKINRQRKNSSSSILYGVWDHSKNDWVLNAIGIGKSKALKMIRLLRAKEMGQ